MGSAYYVRLPDIFDFQIEPTYDLLFSSRNTVRSSEWSPAK
jgi:hypothetical protein